MYRLFEAGVACDFPLPGLPRVSRGEPDILVSMGDNFSADKDYDWFHSWHEKDGGLVLSCARLDGPENDDIHLLRFPDLADFAIAGNIVTCHPRPGCREDSLRHLLLDQVIPRLWAHMGHLVLHASAVQLPDRRVIAFLGESGWGKSTLAAALQSRGCQLLSDDSISLASENGHALLTPSYTGLRLNDDSIAVLGLEGDQWSSVSHYSEKRRFEPAPEEGAGAALPLHTLYVLSEPEPLADISMGALTGAELVTTFIKRSFLLDVRDTTSAKTQLQQATELVPAIPRVLTLAYPRDYRLLDSVCTHLMQGSLS